MVEVKTEVRDHVELHLGGVECIDLMIALSNFIESAKNRRDEQNARCLLIQLSRAAEDGTGTLNYDRAEDYQKAWEACTTPAPTV